VKKFLFVFLIITLFSVSQTNAQRIGEVAPEKPLEVFPPHAWGMDVMFGDAGFGLGMFLRRQISIKWTAFIDFSVSEAKDQREFEYYDPWQGIFVTAFKKNRIYQIPINIGAQYRIFEKSLTDNLRPYINAGVGPTLLVLTPYELEFFNSFGKSQLKYSAGGYVGFGANFGLDKSSLVGVDFRYYYSHVIDGSVQSIEGRPITEIQGFFITLNLGLMY
jgi:hypothetical protein